MSAPRRAAGALVLALVLAGAAALRAQTPAARSVAAARAQLEALNSDSAAVLLRFAVNPAVGASFAERVRAYTLLGIAELGRGQQPAAARALREALALDPELRADSLTDLHADLRATLDAERAAMARARALTLRPEVSSDTLVPLYGGRYHVAVVASARAWVGVSITAVGEAAPTYQDSQLIAGLAPFDWDLRRPDGNAATPGRFRLRFTALDAAGTYAMPVERELELERQAYDTLALPPRIRPADLKPETTYVRRRQWAPLLRGGAFAAGAALLAGFGPAPSGASDGRAYVVGGALALGGFAGFLSGRRVAQADSAAIEQNRRFREADEGRRSSVERANVLVRQQARVRIRMVSGQ